MAKTGLRRHIHIPQKWSVVFADSQMPTAGRRSAYLIKRAETRRKLILDVALEVFAERGFAATHMQEIAKRAGITVVTIYQYFRSKEEIFRSLVEGSVGLQILYLAKLAQDYEGSAADLIRLIVRAIAGFLRSSSRAVLPKLILSESGNFPELARFYRAEVTDRGLGLFESIIRRGVARKEFREIDPQHCARLVLVPVMFTAVWDTSFGKFDSEAYDHLGFIEAHLDLVLRGLAADHISQSQSSNGQCGSRNLQEECD